MILEYTAGLHGTHHCSHGLIPLMREYHQQLCLERPVSAAMQVFVPVPASPVPVVSGAPLVSGASSHAPLPVTLAPTAPLTLAPTIVALETPPRTPLLS